MPPKISSNVGEPGAPCKPTAEKSTKRPATAPSQSQGATAPRTPGKGPKGKSGFNRRGKKPATMTQSGERIICRESLLATEAERQSTSLSMYGDNLARIASNIYQIHDHVRMSAYESVLRTIAGKRVLHVGCGMGLIAMLAAKHGAAAVVAVDTSAIVESAKTVAVQNNLHNITFFRGDVTDIAANFPVKQFDVVLCEWMGAFVTNDAALMKQALYCRDNLLAPTGFICPNRASLHVVGVSDYQFHVETVEYWSNVYGFAMEPMKELVRCEVETCTIPSENISTTAAMLMSVDIADIKLEEVVGGNGKKSFPSLSYSYPFSFAASRDATLHFLTFYVGAKFMNPVDPGANFAIGFRPGGHNAWTEVSVALREWLPVKAGEKVTGTVTLSVEGSYSLVTVNAETEGRVTNAKTSGVYVYKK